MTLTTKKIELFGLKFHFRFPLRKKSKKLELNDAFSPFQIDQATEYAFYGQTKKNKIISHSFGSYNRLV